MTSETYLPRFGGAEIHVDNLIKNLKQKKHDILLFTNEEGGENTGVIRLEWKKKNLFKIWKILWKESPDVDIIHCHYSYRLAAICSVIGRLRGIPVVITLHGMGILNHPDTIFIYQLAHSLYRYTSLKLSTRIISTSEDLAKFAYKYINKDKVSIIMNGFDEYLFNRNVSISKDLLNKNDKNKIIVTVRRLVPKNGVHYLIEAMPYIIEKIPNVKYIIIGDGPMKEYIKDRIQKLGIGGYVDIIGELPSKEIPEYLKLSDVVIFPSTAESSSIACAEAMAVGCSIVASRVGGLVELLGKNEERGRFVRLVDWEDSDYGAPIEIGNDKYRELADVVITSVLDKKKEKLNNALIYAETNLSWESISDQTINLYNKVIKK